MKLRIALGEPDSASVNRNRSSALKGYGSRRISGEHRIVYTVVVDAVLVAQLRYHYV